MKNKKSKNSLKNAIILMSIVIILGLSVYVAVVIQTKNQLLNAFGERSYALATFTMSEIDRVVQKTLLDVGLFTNRIKDSTELRESNNFFANLENRDEEIARIDQEWKESAEPNDFMKSLFERDLSKELIRYFPHQKRDGLSDSDVQTAYSEIFITNAYGVNVAQTNITSDYYQADEEWWQMAAKEGLYVEDIEFDDSASKYSISISSGIFDAKGELLGVVKVVWDIDEIVELLGIIELERKDRKIFGETTHLTLLTESQDVIYSSRKDFKFLDNVSDNEIGTVVKSSTNDVYTISKGAGGSDNVARFVTFAKSSGFDTFDGLNWVLVFEQDIKEVLAPIKTTQIIIGSIIVIFILLIFYIVYVYTKHIRLVQKLKEEFISIASHQLKTPISVIKWAVETIEDTSKKMPKDVREWFDTISDNINQMDRLVNDLLNLSRLESGRLEVEPTDLNIKSKISDIVEKLKEPAEKNGLNLKNVVSQDINKTVPMDESILELIITNLLTNAIKYSPNGGEVLVSLDKNGEFLEFSVKDQGIGIPKNLQENIFKKFYRASNAEESEISGTGLGLFVVKQIVVGLGGEIWFDSIEGKGTTFYIKLPATGMKKGKIKAY